MTHHNAISFAILFRPHGPKTIDQVSDGRKDISVRWYGPMYHCVVSSSRGQGTTTMTNYGFVIDSELSFQSIQDSATKMHSEFTDNATGLNRTRQQHLSSSVGNSIIRANTKS